MRTKEQLSVELESAERELYREFNSTAKSSRVYNIIIEYYGKDHKFMDNYKQANTENAFKNIITIIKDEIKNYGYDWWNFHEQPPKHSKLEQYFKSNPKIYEFLLKNTGYILTAIGTAIGAAITYFKQINLMGSLIFIGLFIISLVLIINGIAKSSKKI